MKKKLLSVVLATTMVASLLAGCGSKTSETGNADGEQSGSTGAVFKIGGI